MTQRRITDNLDALLGVLPPSIAAAVTQANNSDFLLEIVMDLGRRPIARFVGGDQELSQSEVTRADRKPLCILSQVSTILVKLISAIIMNELHCPLRKLIAHCPILFADRRPDMPLLQPSRDQITSSLRV